MKGGIFGWGFIDVLESFQESFHAQRLEAEIQTSPFLDMLYRSGIREG